MLLTLTSTAAHATDLGFLLHKHPERVQEFPQAFGTAYVFYPEASDERCTVALLLEVDPVGIVRNKRFGSDGFALSQYVNDRPYAASSMLAVTLGKVFGTALRGECKARPELPDQAIPLEIHIPAVATRGGGADLVRRLFEPLGWHVEARTEPLDEVMPSWGDSRYVDLRLHGTRTVAAALSHLYVLLPVLDGSKHYWVSNDEVDKLVRRGGEWLATHPERELVTRRYLAHRRAYVADATARLDELDDSARAADLADIGDTAETADTDTPRRRTLAEERRAAVVAALHEVGAHRVVDLGCGEGTLLTALLAAPFFAEIVGVDVCAPALRRAADRVGLDRLPDHQRARVTLRQSSATYRDTEIEGYDAVVLMEVIEHVDLDRLPSLERSVFGHARPRAVVVTTPNAEFNVRYESIPPGGLRHPDHRFEWSRVELTAWCERIGTAYGYAVQVRPVGEVDAEVGSPTQLALFTLGTEGAGA